MLSEICNCTKIIPIGAGIGRKRDPEVIIKVQADMVPVGHLKEDDFCKRSPGSELLAEVEVGVAVCSDGTQTAVSVS